mgnify:CR=1 FL=1
MSDEQFAVLAETLSTYAKSDTVEVVDTPESTDTSDPIVRESLSTDEKVEPLLRIWFQSGSDLDEFCQPFASVIRELKNSPATLILSLIHI